MQEKPKNETLTKAHHTRTIDMSKFEQPIKARTTLEPMYRSEDTEGNIVDCNYKYARMLGYSKDEVIGMSIFDHTPEEYHDAIRTIFERWKERMPINNRKFPLLTRSGQVFNVLVTVHDVLGVGGKLVRSETTLLDSEEVNILQEKVKLSKYESLYENSPDMYRTVNIEGIIIDCNRAYQEKIGYTKEEIIGRNLVEHTADRSISAILINMARWRRNGVCVPAKLWLKRKDNTEFPSMVTPTNLFDDDGALLGRNVVIQDMSEMEKQKVILEEQQRIDQMKDEFLTGITHELKTPLTPIIGFSQAMAKPGMLGELNPKQTDAVKTILNNALHLRQLVMDLLDVHKLELGRMKFERKEFSIAMMMDAVQSSVVYAAEAKSVDIVFAVESDEHVLGDQFRVAEVLTNLIYNAIDFVPKEGGKINVSMERKDEETLLFNVIDNGTGIPDDKQAELFNKFYQVSTTVTRQHGGTGLGLSICKGLVEGMGGIIGVDSVEGEGSTFYFTVKAKSID